MTRLKKGELPPLTGVLTTCKVCKENKDDALFKWQGGKRQGLVCRACDLAKKRNEYATDEEMRAKFIERSRQWAEANPEELYWRGVEYRAKHEAELKEKKRLDHIANREHNNARTKKHWDEKGHIYMVRNKEWRKENAEKLKEQQAEYYANNKQRYKDNNERWKIANPGRMNAYIRKYNTSKMQRLPIWADLEAISKIYENCPEGYAVDHQIPLQGKFVSGLHLADNLRYLTKSENSRKGNYFDYDEYANGTGCFAWGIEPNKQAD